MYLSLTLSPFLHSQERDTAVARESELVRELDMLKERLEGSQRAWSATRAELEEREGRFARTEVQAREFETTIRGIEASYRYRINVVRNVVLI